MAQIGIRGNDKSYRYYGVVLDCQGSLWFDTNSADINTVKKFCKYQTGYEEHPSYFLNSSATIIDNTTGKTVLVKREGQISFVEPK